MVRFILALLHLLCLKRIKYCRTEPSVAREKHCLFVKVFRLPIVHFEFHPILQLVSVILNYSINIVLLHIVLFYTHCTRAR